MLIDGNIYLTEKTNPVLSPATGHTVGLAPQASKEQLENAIAAAHRAQTGWSRLPAAQRLAALKGCAATLRQNAEALATLQTNESGRPLQETRLEIMVAAASFDNAAVRLDLDEEEEISEDAEKRVVVRRSPLGVVAVIAPWNAPIVLGWKPTSCALACGNTVVLKPAPQTPLTTLRIGELLRKQLPAGVLNVLVGSDDVAGVNELRPGEVLTASNLVRKVVFTGSTNVGSKVMEACAKDFKRVLLELGGNDAAIIRADCDVDAIADGVFKAVFFNNGQTCCAIKRIYVHQSIFDPFVQALAKRARRAVIGNGLTKGVELGPLANDLQLKHVTQLVKDAIQDGGRVLCGGGATAGPPGDQGTGTGLFYLPTIVVGVQEGSRLVDEEQFGPVVPVMPYATDDEAVRRANGTSYGLGASVWGGDLAKANAMADRLRAGTVWVNRHCEFIRNAPFGGFGSSGIGRAGDTARDLAEYTELRTLVLARPPTVVQDHVPQLQVVEIDDRARDLLRQQLAKIVARLDSEADKFEEEAREVVRVFPFQPLSLRQTLQSLVDADGKACTVVRGLPTHLSSSGPAAAVRGEADDGSGLAAEALLLGTVAQAGARVFAYRDYCGEALVRTLSEESDDIFGWRRAGRCSPPLEIPRRFFREEANVPELVAAFCSHSSEPVSVKFVDFRALAARADDEDLECLRKSPLCFFDLKSGFRMEPRRVVSTDLQSVPIIDIRPTDRFEVEGSRAAVEAYHRVCKQAKAASETVELQAGDLVIFNNKLCAQAWSPTAVGGDTVVRTVYASRAATAWPDRVTP